MSTVADFDPDVALDRLLAGMENLFDAVNQLTIAVLTIESNDHRRARLLVQEAIDLFTNPDTRLDLRDWTKEARQLVPPLDEPLPTADEVRGILSPEAPLPTIHQDDEHEPLFPRRATDE